MRILLMCEGQNEEVLLNNLLDADALCFTRDDLIGRRPYPIRQLSNPTIKSELKHYGLPVKIYRVGDKQNDKLSIPKDLKGIVSSREIYKYCTKPELEMLFILAENLEQDFEKLKSLMKAKTFAKEHISIGKRNYDNSTAFYTEYFGENPKLLVDCIKNTTSIMVPIIKTNIIWTNFLNN